MSNTFYIFILSDKERNVKYFLHFNCDSVYLFSVVPAERGPGPSAGYVRDNIAALPTQGRAVLHLQCKLPDFQDGVVSFFIL